MALFNIVIATDHKQMTDIDHAVFSAKQGDYSEFHIIEKFFNDCMVVIQAQKNGEIDIDETIRIMRMGLK